jgi:hypothetical protein
MHGFGAPVFGQAQTKQQALCQSYKQSSGVILTTADEVIFV